MSVETVYTCCWRECDSHVRSAIPGNPDAFITVEEDGGRSKEYFCSWDCLLLFAGEMPPAVVIPTGGEID